MLVLRSTSISISTLVIVVLLIIIIIVIVSIGVTTIIITVIMSELHHNARLRKPGKETQRTILVP